LDEVKRMVAVVTAELDIADISARKTLDDALQGLGLDNIALPNAQTKASEIITKSTVLRLAIDSLPPEERASARQDLTSAIIQAESVRDYASERGRIISNQLKAFQAIEEAETPKEAQAQRDIFIERMEASYKITWKELDDAEKEINENRPDSSPENTTKKQMELEEIQKRKDSLRDLWTTTKSNIIEK